MAESVDLVELAKTVTLRRGDLYNGLHAGPIGSPRAACFMCATHVAPQYLYQHKAIARHLAVFADYKANRPAFHDTPNGFAMLSKRVWQAQRRWLTTGAACDVLVVDRLMTQIGHVMTPWTFPPEAWLRRVSFPWDESAYAVRIAYVWSLMNFARVLEGKPPLRESDAPALDVPTLVIDPVQGGHCPVCGGFGAGSAKHTTSEQRHAATRRRKRAQAKMSMGAPGHPHSGEHEDLTHLQLQVPPPEGASDAGRGRGRSADSRGAFPAPGLGSSHGSDQRRVHRARPVHPQSRLTDFAQLVLFGADGQ